MKNPSRTLVNWLAIGLIVLFVWVLLVSVIVPKLRGTAAGDLAAANTATPDGTLTPSPTWANDGTPQIDLLGTPTLDPNQAALISAPAGAVITNQAVGDIPANTRVGISTWYYGAQGWVFQIVTLDYQTNAEASIDQLALDPAWDASQPTPAPRYADYAYLSSCNPLMLTEDVSGLAADQSEITIPGGTHVHVGSRTGNMEYVEGKGYTWRYVVVVQDHSQSLDPGAGVMSAQVTEDQLEPVPGVQIVPGGATATSGYIENASGPNFITLEDVGSIAKGTRVSIGSSYLDCDTWVYQISPADGSAYEWIKADQLTYAPDYTPGAPTATLYPIEASPTPTAAGVIARTIGDPVTNLRLSPTLDADNVIAEVPPGTELPVIGVWAGHDWYLVEWWQSTTGQAWVYAPLVTVDGDLTLLPQITPMP